MRVRLSTVLLLGAMTITAGSLAAQTPRPQSRTGLALTWDGMRSNIAGGGSFWMQGAGLQLHERIWRGLGAVADIAGTHTGNIGSTGVGLDLLTVTFGPRYTWSRGKVSLYGQGLVGQAFGFHSLFPSPRGVNTSDNSLAALAGGGVDVSVSPRLAVRLLEADWLRTQLPNSYNNTQNDLRLSAGVVFRFR
jgi:outer membrane immunogenic protein